MRKTSFIFAGVMATIIGTAYAVGENTVASKAYVDTKQVKIPVAGTNANTPGESVVTYTDTAGTIGERGIFDSDTGWDDENETIVEGHEGDLMPAGEVVPAMLSTYNTVNVMMQAMSGMSGTAGTVVVRNNEGAPYAAADIYDGSTTYDAQNNADDLITAGAVQGQISNIDTNITNMNNSITNITNQMNAMPLETIEIQRLTCANPCTGGRACPAGTYCTLWTIGDAGVAHKLYSCTAQTVATDCPACGTGTVKACVDNVCKCRAVSGPGGTCSTLADCDQSDCNSGARKCTNGRCGSLCETK